MLEDLAQLPFAMFLRRSVWAYPLVNAAHILALGALITSAIVMDLRVLRIMGRSTITDVVGVLRPVAMAALALALVTGFLLFSVRPTEYTSNPAFLIKLGVLALAVANAGVFVLTRRHLEPDALRTRLMASASILLWLAVLLAGRSIAFAE